MELVENKKITVLGAARSGIASAILLKKHKARALVSDLAKPDQKIEEKSRLDKAHIEYEFGGHSDRIYDADFVVL